LERTTIPELRFLKPLFDFIEECVNFVNTEISEEIYRKEEDKRKVRTERNGSAKEKSFNYWN
jgi:hypothetical protein